jgi:hypothetical protein
VAFVHAALDDAVLGAAVARAVGPGAPAPMRGMAARGLVPLGPRDLLVALYQLWVTNDPDLAEIAAKTVEGLPAGVLAGALEARDLPAGVLDFVGRKLPRNAEMLERVVRHPAVHDETLAGISRICPESVCDVLAENQQRWLAFPAIVEALYQNPQCRMSVVHRMLELAVREGVEVGLPNMDEIKHALAEGWSAEPARDDVFKEAVRHEVADTHARVIDTMRSAGADAELDLDGVREETGGELDLDRLLAADASDDLSLPLAAEDVSEGAAEGDARAQQALASKLGRNAEGRVTLIGKLRPMEKLRLAIVGNAFERFVLVRDSNKMVALATVKSPRVKENEVVAYAANRTLAHEVIRYICNRRDWTKLYAITMNLVLNPKTPMASAMTFLGRLHHHDVKKVAFSKAIPSALATAAKRKLDQRK